VRVVTGGRGLVPAMACTAIASVTIPIRAASSAAGDPRGTAHGWTGWKSPNPSATRPLGAREARCPGRPALRTREVGGAHITALCRNARERAVDGWSDLG